MNKIIPHAYSERRLTALSPGECGVVTELGEQSDSARLKSMGICLGRTLEVVKAGDPLIIKVYGTRIGLSARLAEHVRMETCAGALRCWERRVHHAE
jgi:Fe2+ transport system protein FeoA